MLKISAIIFLVAASSLGTYISAVEIKPAVNIIGRAPPKVPKPIPVSEEKKTSSVNETKDLHSSTTNSAQKGSLLNTKTLGFGNVYANFEPSEKEPSKSSKIFLTLDILSITQMDFRGDGGDVNELVSLPIAATEVLPYSHAVITLISDKLPPWDGLGGGYESPQISIKFYSVTLQERQSWSCKTDLSTGSCISAEITNDNFFRFPTIDRFPPQFEALKGFGATAYPYVGYRNNLKRDLQYFTAMDKYPDKTLVASFNETSGRLSNVQVNPSSLIDAELGDMSTSLSSDCFIQGLEESSKYMPFQDGGCRLKNWMGTDTPGVTTTVLTYDGLIVGTEILLSKGYCEGLKRKGTRESYRRAFVQPTSSWAWKTDHGRTVPDPSHWFVDIDDDKGTASVGFVFQGGNEMILDEWTEAAPIPETANGLVLGEMGSTSYVTKISILTWVGLSVVGITILILLVKFQKYSNHSLTIAKSERRVTFQTLPEDSTDRIPKKKAKYRRKENEDGDVADPIVSHVALFPARLEGP